MTLARVQTRSLAEVQRTNLEVTSIPLVTFVLMFLSFRLCSTYPKLHIVPAMISDKEMEAVVKFRTSGRFPSVVWRYKKKIILNYCFDQQLLIPGKRHNFLTQRRYCHLEREWYLNCMSLVPVQAHDQWSSNSTL